MELCSMEDKPQLTTFIFRVRHTTMLTRGIINIRNCNSKYTNDLMITIDLFICIIFFQTISIITCYFILSIVKGVSQTSNQLRTNFLRKNADCHFHNFRYMPFIILSIVDSEEYSDRKHETRR